MISSAKRQFCRKSLRTSNGRASTAAAGARVARTRRVRFKVSSPEAKAFAKIETALAELQGLGLRHAEVDFTKWSRERNTLT